jgi:hypothetical protein
MLIQATWRSPRRSTKATRDGRMVLEDTMSRTPASLRGGAAALGTVVVMLGLAGCQAAASADASAAGKSPAATSSTTASAETVVQLPTTSTTASTYRAPAPASAPPSPAATPLSPIPPSPTPTACSIPEQSFVHIVGIGFDSATSLDQIDAQPATALCGGGLPDDAQYTATGPAVEYDVSPAVKITGVGLDGQPFSETWSQFAASDLGQYGGFYGIDVNGGVEVTQIDQYFHP